MAKNKSQEQILSALRLMRTQNIGPITYHHLIACFGDPLNALNAVPNLAHRGGRRKPLKITSLSEAEKELKALEKMGGRFVLHKDPDYPKPLANIADPPPLFAILGDETLLQKSIIAIVGSRNASYAAQKIAKRFARGLSEAGICVVSGFARGIDAAAHKGALGIEDQKAVLSGKKNEAKTVDTKMTDTRMADTRMADTKTDKVETDEIKTDEIKAETISKNQTHKQAHEQTYKQADKKADKKIDEKIDEEIDKKASKKASKEASKEADSQTYGEISKGKTIAVLGSGIDVIYPKENTPLYESIKEEGLFISEHKIATQPLAQYFPRRNRIIAGLSLGVVVIEAAFKSGSLITARLAGEEGREVMVVPGSPLDARCRGSNNLIRNGATLVETIDDILDIVRALEERQMKEPPPPSYHPRPEKPTQPTKEERETFISLLSPTPTSLDELIARSGFSVSCVHMIILELELAGLIERTAGGDIALIDAPS